MCTRRNSEGVLYLVPPRAQAVRRNMLLFEQIHHDAYRQHHNTEGTYPSVEADER